MEQTQDFIVSSLLSELKSENERKARVIKNLLIVIWGCVASILVVIGGFLWYLNQYDFSSTETINATANGVYALIDSEGNVIAQDLTAEEIQEVLNGQSNENGSSDEIED